MPDEMKGFHPTPTCILVSSTSRNSFLAPCTVIAVRLTGKTPGKNVGTPIPLIYQGVVGRTYANEAYLQTDRSHKIDLFAFFTELFLLVLDPLSSPSRWLERIGKVLCLAGNLAIAKLHNADCLSWLLVIAEHVLGDP